MIRVENSGCKVPITRPEADLSGLSGERGSPHSHAAPSRKLWGMVCRRERWGLSWRGRLVVLAITTLAAGALFLCIYPFLAINHRVDTNILVVEGWVHKYAISAAVNEFKGRCYQRVFSTGGPITGSGGYINDFNTAASVGADLLQQAGVPVESLQMVPSRVMDRDRTYGSAVALGKWLHEHQ